MLLIAGVVLYWLGTSRLAWAAIGLVLLSVPGVFLTLYLRDVGFHAFGGACTPDKARGFMEAMQWVFLLQSAAGVVGCAILAGLAVRKHGVVGAILLVALTCASLFSAFFIYFGTGMTAVDGYRC